MSLVLTYNKIVPKTNHRLRLFLWCIAAYVVAGCIATTAADAFWCGAGVSINWQVPRKAPAPGPQPSPVAGLCYYVPYSWQG